MKITTHYSDDEIRQVVGEGVDLAGRYYEYVISLRDQGIREALVKLGWTPPGEDRGAPARRIAQAKAEALEAFGARNSLGIDAFHDLMQTIKVLRRRAEEGVDG